MKIFLRIFLVAFVFGFYGTVYAYSSPGMPTGYVTDFANIISDQTQAALENQLKDFSASTSIEIAVVTIKSLNGDSVENYANQLFREWGIGKKEYNNGILFLISPNDRKTRIEVGYGLEGAMPDIQAGYIIDNIIIPEFKNSNYEQGIILGTNAIIKVVSGEKFEVSDNIDFDGFSGFAEIGFVVIFIAFQWLLSMLASTKSWWLGGVFGVGSAFALSYFWGLSEFPWTLVAILGGFGLILDYLVSRSYRNYLKKGGKKSAWNWGFGSGSGRGGSGGGFGGGGSGGGGASGSW